MFVKGLILFLVGGLCLVLLVASTIPALAFFAPALIPTVRVVIGGIGVGGMLGFIVPIAALPKSIQGFLDKGGVGQIALRYGAIGALLAFLSLAAPLMRQIIDVSAVPTQPDPFSARIESLAGQLSDVMVDVYAPAALVVCGLLFAIATYALIARRTFSS